MAANTIDNSLLCKMFLAGAKNLEANKEYINELNVFPVPDGDTGTNMTMTIMSAAKDVAGGAGKDLGQDRALDALGLKACDVIMAGDSRYDIIGAKEAGCASIGVTYGYGTREELIENGADYLVDAPLEMKKILNL